MAEQKKIRGSIPCRLSGGPLDGAMYGDLPDTGKPQTGARLSIPLSQPHEDAPRAIYVCPDPAEPGEPWTFHYYKTVYPGLPVGTEVRFK